MPAEDPDRPFEVPQILNVAPRRLHRREPRPSELAAAGVREFALILTHPKLRGATGAWTSPDRPRLRRTRHAEHYDVIIIGTGAGGGTLAHRLAPSGKRILLLERGGYLPREPENWDSEEVFGKDRYLSDERLDTTSTATPFKPARAVLRGRQHEVLRRDPLPPARARLRARSSHYGGVSPGVADLVRRPRAVLHARPSGSTWSTARRARTRPSRSRSGPFPHPAVSHEPRIQQLARRLRAHRPPPVPPAGRRRPRRERPGGGPLRALRPLRRLPVPDRRQGRRPRPAACGRRSSTPTSRCCTHAQGRAARDRRRAAATVTRGRGRPPRRARRRYSADVVVVVVRRRSTRRRCCCARPPTATRTGSPTPPTWSGRNYMAHINSGVIAISQTPNTTKFQKTLGVNDYYWGAEDSDAPARAHPDARQVATSNILRAGAPWFAPGLALDYMAKHAIDFWLTTEDLPHPDNRVTVDRHGPDPPVQDLPQRRAAQAPAGASSRGCSASSAATRAPIPRCVGARPADPAGRHRAPVRHRALRRRPGDVGARRQLQGARRSTTSTWSTRASSRRRAR